MQYKSGVVFHLNYNMCIQKMYSDISRYNSHN